MSKELAPIAADEHYGLDTGGMAAGLALLFNDRLYERCKDVARVMAGAKGITPGHLIGNPEACFGVVQMSVTWKLTPQLVAMSTYQTPGGKIGFEGKLVQAIIENSGKVEGNVKYELVGDWDKVRGKHKMKQSERGKEYAVADWKPEDEAGLGVIVSVQVKGEVEPRSTGIIFLNSCWPRNSTLWALRPEQQIKYLGARVLANTVTPGIFMGVPIEGDVDDEGMKDVTPNRPEPAGSFFSGKPPEEVKQEPPKVEGPPVIATKAEAWDAGIKANHNGEKMHEYPKGLAEEFREDFKGGWKEAEDARPAENRLYKEKGPDDPDPRYTVENANRELEGPAPEDETQDTDNPGPPEAMDAGREARRSNLPYKVPEQWAELSGPWQAGWNAEDAEIKAAKKGK